MTTGDVYYVRDNSHIRKKTGYSRDHVRNTDLSKRSHNNGGNYVPYQSYGGARPKTTLRYVHGPTHGNRNNDYGTPVSTHPSSHTRYYEGTTRRPEVRRQNSDGRPPSDLYKYDHYSESLTNDHTIYGLYTQQYNSMYRSVNPHYNQRQNSDIRYTYVLYKKRRS